jgi:hypothetical protein
MSIRRLIFSRKYKGYQPSQIKADAGDDIVTTNPETILLDGSGSFTDAPPLGYHWDIISGRSFTIKNPDYEQTEIEYLNVLGDNVVRLLVSDGSNNSDTDEINIKIEQQLSDLYFDVTIPNAVQEGVIKFWHGVPNSLVKLNFQITDNEFSDYVDINQVNGTYSVRLEMHQIMDTHSFYLDSNGELFLQYGGYTEEQFNMTTSVYLYENGAKPNPDTKTIQFYTNPDDPIIGY